MGGHREKIESGLIAKSKGAVFSFKPREHHPLIDSLKDGSAGHSSSAFALYSNGHKKDSQSALAPFGLLYHDGKVMFSIGCFRRGMDGRHYLVLTNPKGNGISCRDRVRKTADFVERILDDSALDVAGAYVRFLDLDNYLLFLNSGFLPAKEHPWHHEAPEEDETYCHGLIDLNHFQDHDRKKYKRHVRARFINFLRRNSLEYKFAPFAEIEDAKNRSREIVSRHFSFLRENRKDIGSTPEDYFNLMCTEISDLPPVISYFGILSSKDAMLPVSVFVCEQNFSGLLAAYATITLRDPTHVLSNLGLDPSNENHTRGFSAISAACFIGFIEKVCELGYSRLHVGGSETRELDDMKRRLGAKPNPTYWAVKLK